MLILLFICFTRAESLTVDEFFNARSVNVGFALLKTSPDPINLSLGDAGTAGYSSASNFIINPASPSFIKEKSVLFNYRYSLSAINVSYISIQSKLLGGEIAFSTGYSASDTIPLRNELPTSEHLGLYRFSSFTTSLSYSREVVSGVYAGLLGRSISEFSFDLAKTSFVAGAGLVMEFQSVRGFSAGISLLNIGTRVRYDETSVDYIIPPFTLRAGLRENYRFSDKIETTVYVDFIKVNDQKYKISLSNELMLLENFLVRAGYIFNDETRFFSLGIGMKTERLRIDYAVAPYMYNLGIDNSISLTYNF